MFHNNYVMFNISSIKQFSHTRAHYQQILSDSSMWFVFVQQKSSKQKNGFDSIKMKKIVGVSIAIQFISLSNCTYVFLQLLMHEINCTPICLKSQPNVELFLQLITVWWSNIKHVQTWVQLPAWKDETLFWKLKLVEFETTYFCHLIPENSIAAKMRI